MLAAIKGWALENRRHPPGLLCHAGSRSAGGSLALVGWPVALSRSKKARARSREAASAQAPRMRYLAVAQLVDNHMATATCDLLRLLTTVTPLLGRHFFIPLRMLPRGALWEMLSTLGGQ